METTVTRVVPPLVQALICQVQYADIYASGKIKLFYFDGTQQAGTPKPYDRESFFALVSAVQAAGGKRQ